jgi:short-subunit dehydrogenase
VSTFDFVGATAVVTGAASGIGEALARGLAARGCNLVLLDREGERLAAVATSIQSGHSTVDVETYVVDLADPSATNRVTDEILAAHPRIRLLINNAGVALRGRFDQVTLEEFFWVIDINFKAVVRMTHALLPALKAEPGSHLVNMSSLFGIIAPYGQTAYAASKFGVRGFTEALREELTPNGITVTCVHPGGVHTRIALDSRTGSGVSAEELEAGRDEWQRVLTMDPAEAAGIILRGVQTRRRRVLISRTAKVLDVVARLFPSSYGSIITSAARRRLERQPATGQPVKS